MSGTAKKKSAEGAELVTLPRAEYEALLARIEDAEDAAVVAAAELRERAVGKQRARRDHLSSEMAKRMILGESPVRIWREHRGLKALALAEKAGLPAGYLSEIETGKKPGSLDAMKRIADALEVPLDNLVRTDGTAGKRGR
ncbi:hypothetical protein FRZ44_21500 [Hypericibacter terrae]|uniref:HTH cro/C1-type domain-containing protein n=1 Tax=Hypericibacter terrae TaxID=2602015 RepID=A0A5J6MK32_9PROT|nr:helix-turn-helix transcriptional regulator [Hypericibacter terrae]QEX16855.1 hypothetical protein FRZ44_21500 [Hypericibacter terrae]